MDRTGPGRAGGTPSRVLRPRARLARDADHRPADLATPREGPCIVEEYDATCVIPPGAHATLDAHGNIVIELAEETLMSPIRDPIGFELFRNTLLSIADEMALTILRTAYSGVLRDNMDYSTAFCDARRPHGGAGPHLARASQLLPRRARRDDRALRRPHEARRHLLSNDPFEGGMHIPDVFVLKPIFFEGERVAFAATICHQTDMGGRVAGSNASDSTEIYQEGLRIPPVKMYDQGEPNETLFRIFEKNVRVPGEGVRRSPRAARRVSHRGGGVPAPDPAPRREAGEGVHG